MKHAYVDIGCQLKTAWARCAAAHVLTEWSCGCMALHIRCRAWCCFPPVNEACKLHNGSKIQPAREHASIHSMHVCPMQVTHAFDAPPACSVHLVCPPAHAQVVNNARYLTGVGRRVGEQTEQLW